MLDLGKALLLDRKETNASKVGSDSIESEERFRTTFEQAAVGMAHVALDGHWLLVNQRLCDIVGYHYHQELYDSNRGCL